jgi:hypothetical protein
MSTPPQAYHAGIATFMRRPLVGIEALRPGMVAVAGIPFDGTSGSRPGARWGPRGIRQSSAYFDYFLRSSPDDRYVDLETGEEVRFPGDLGLVDLGDVELFPTDLARTSGAIAAFVERVARTGAFPLILGGDHYVTLPCVEGFLAGLPAVRPGARVGYVAGRLRPRGQPPRHVRPAPRLGPRLPRLHRASGERAAGPGPREHAARGSDGARRPGDLGLPSEARAHPRHAGRGAPPGHARGARRRAREALRAHATTSMSIDT